MFSLVDDKKMLSIMDGYYSVLEKTGYVKHDTVQRLLLYEFLYDFVNNTVFFIDEDAYMKIDELLRRLFSNAGCIMSYPVFCVNRVKLSKYAADGTVRITEDNYFDEHGNTGNQARITEDGIIRIA